MNLSFSQRAPMQPVTRRVRAYFAPVDRGTSAPGIFDPAKDGRFDLDAPPQPWIDCGWIANFVRSSATRIAAMRSGVKALAQQQYRSAADATLEFDFRDWGKVQMAVSAGSQHMNLLAEDLASSPAPSGGIPLPPVAMLPGSTASEIVVGAGAVNSFDAGDLIAVDVDYALETGYIGAGIAGAFVKDPADVLFDPHYVRRITFNVGRISGKTSTTLQLAQPLLGGDPQATAQLQKVVGFVDREGGSFFQEWSALFVCDSETGARVFYHYPRLQPARPAQEKPFELGGAFDGWSLHASLVALPTTDSADKEQVLCYRSFIPARNAALY